jgi:hypothetical protein
MQRNDACLATVLLRWEILRSGSFVNGKKVHTAYGYCDRTKKHKQLMQKNTQCWNVLSEFYRMLSVKRDSAVSLRK